MATFNIGRQNAASIQNIEGDVVIEGGIHASASWETLELRRAIARAHEGTAELSLGPGAREAVNKAFDVAAREAGQPKPDKHSVAEHLAIARRTLEDAGALVDSGNTVVDSLRRAASLLGPVGLAVIGAL